MKNKIIHIVYPNGFNPNSDNTFLPMCELLINAFIFSKKEMIRFHVNNGLRFIECNDKEIKKILDLLLKSGKLAGVRNQVSALLHKNNSHPHFSGILKFLIEDKQRNLSIKEVKSGADFSWEVSHRDKY